MPESKIPGSVGKIVPSPRIGEAASATEQDPKSPALDLRRRACLEGPCKEPPPKPPVPVPCKDKPCACPLGEVRGAGGGCIASSAHYRQCPPGELGIAGACTPTASQCPVDEYWNGTTCARRCQPGEYWNGASCVSSSDCASIQTRASSLANEVRGARTQMQTACTTDPAGQECLDFKQSYDFAIQRYRILLNQAPVSCRASLPDPLSL